MTITSLDNQIAELQKQRERLLSVQPLLEAYAKLVGEIKAFLPDWKPTEAPTSNKRKRFDVRSVEFIKANNGPMTLEQLVTAFNGEFNKDTLQTKLAQNIASQRPMIKLVGDKYESK